MKADFYIIRAISNLHVGSGDSTFGVIDNLVQRDPITELPTIFGSSLKGALREHFEVVWGKDSNKIKSIFGSDPKEQKESIAGEYKFLSAQLLSLPARSNIMPYFIATTKSLIESFYSNMELLNFNSLPKPDLSAFTDINHKPTIQSKFEKLIIEDFYEFNSNMHNSYQDIGEKLFGANSNNLMILNDKDFKQLCGPNNLPVIARNKLENGKSSSLWYEEIVPRESRFWCCIMHTDKFFSEFENGLLHPETLIQIGANATVGYGLCEFIKVGK
ncbi:MAG: type III-B CRISPR module RAMP protein Cmr4 [Candidatus Woesearchaeota archaeon]